MAPFSDGPLPYLPRHHRGLRRRMGPRFRPSPPSRATPRPGPRFPTSCLIPLITGDAQGGGAVAQELRHRRAAGHRPRRAGAGERGLLPGADHEGHPVCYDVYSEFQDKELYEKAFGDNKKRERFLKWRIQLLERGIREQLDFSPSGICSMVHATDLKNTPPMLGKHRAVNRQALALLQDNYPESIAKKQTR